MASYRTLFISDVHLGTRAAQADLLLDFLRNNDAETIYLVGDIIDFWRIRRGAIWPQSHNDVLQKLLRKVRKGTRVVFIPGNHDEAMRQYCGMQFGGVKIARQTIHTTADGRRYLVIHGDEFDVVVRYAKWLAFLGDRGYELALWANRPLNFIRRHFGDGPVLPYVGRIARQFDNVHYVNTGDWVESCTAIGENRDGAFELIRWLDVTDARERDAQAQLDKELQVA